MKRLAFAVATMGLAGFAVAAHAADEERKVEKIEVTGSSIKRIAKEGALPVQTFKREDIQRSGATSVQDLVQKLPSMQGFTAPAVSVGGGGGGFSGASIHNIGEEHTLVLLNGTRVANWAGNSFQSSGGVDLNTLPVSAIERVEILTDGASAIYGSDAIGGVINFILRKNETAGEVTLTGTVPSKQGGADYKVSVTKGFGDLNNDGFNVLLGYSHDEQKAMKATDREFAKSGLIDFEHNGRKLRFFNGSINSIPANLEVYRESIEDDAYFGTPYYDINGKCAPAHVFRGGACRFDYTSTIEINPESKQDSFVGSFSARLGGDHTLYGDLLHSKFKMTSRIAPAPMSGFAINNGTAGWNNAMAQAHAADPTFVADADDQAIIYFRALDAGNRTTLDETTATHATLGLKGVLVGWDYNVGYTHSESKWDEYYTRGWVSANKIQAALDNLVIDPFKLPGSNVAAFNDIQFTGLYKSAKSTLDSVDVRGSHELFEMPGGSAMLGVGASFVREAQNYNPSSTARGVGDQIAGDSATEVPFDVSRNAWGVFSELALPVANNLELTGSVRHDSYDKVNDGSATTAKVSARWQPAKTILVRASYGTGFKVPTVTQTQDGFVQQFGVTGGTHPACLAVPAGDPLSGVCYPSATQWTQFNATNADLRPEKSEQWTIGFRVEPTSNFSIGVDLWNVKIDDLIDSVDEDTAFADPATYRSAFSSWYNPQSRKNEPIFLAKLFNMGTTVTRGLDIDGRLGFKTPIGRLTTQLGATYMLKNDYQTIKGGDFHSNVGKYEDGEVTFRFISKLSATLESGAFTHVGTLNYKSGYRDVVQRADDPAGCAVRSVNADGTTGGCVTVDDHQVGSYTTFDWQTRYQLNKSLALTFGVLNLFDRDPPFTIRNSGPHQLGYDARYTDPRGRAYSLSGSFKF
ncbi:TonB-dependent receptor domain-containing protein [Chitinimonas koreensis]|nr:TonB-dependent receptor [Chitinimonas koreensis]QNM97822.1 TonB-dependent receptor [Chitinimonas koreensis]